MAASWGPALSCARWISLAILVSSAGVARAAQDGGKLAEPEVAGPKVAVPPPQPVTELPPPPDVFGELVPDGPSDLVLGETLLRLGRHGEAAPVFRRAIAKDPNDLLAHERLRETLIAAQRQDLLPKVLVKLIELYQAGGNGDAAGRRLAELATLAPADAETQRLQRLIGNDASTRPGETTLGQRLRSALGVFVILGLAWLLSTNRRLVQWRVVAWGMGLQLLFAVLVLKSPPGRRIFDAAQAAVDRVIAFSDEGAAFIFGNLYRGLAPGAASGPLQLVDATSRDYVSLGLVFGMHVLPTIVFIGALMGVLYHLGVMQKVVHAIAWVMRRTMKTSGAESLSTAANIFVGQTEAPLIVKPYLATMTRSELMAVMVGGFATVAGGVLAAYVRFGIDAGHLIAASFMGAPATLVIAKLMVPETETPVTAGTDVKDPPRTTTNVFDAAASGATDGLHLALNVGAMLVAFIALVAMVNWALGFAGFSLAELFGYLFYPLSWCMGVDTADMMAFGHLLGTKLSLNEFVAYIDLGRMKPQLSERTFVIATYALCGFANFSSIGIQIGGLAGMAPERRADLARLGLRAMFAGALATCLMACIAGLLI